MAYVYYPGQTDPLPEFQTGLSQQPQAQAALFDLARLQDGVGRDLHLMLIGAAQFIGQVRRHFKSFTVIDSRPFMATVKRRRFVLSDNGDQEWVRNPTEHGESLDELLAENMTLYSAWINARVAGNIASYPKAKSVVAMPHAIDPSQTLLDFDR